MLFDKTEIFVVVDRSFIHTDRKTPLLELLAMRSVSFDLISGRMESINIGGIFFFNNKNANRVEAFKVFLPFI